MMSYDELFRAWRAEREAEGLARLPDDFYKRAAELVAAIRASLKMADSRALRTRLAKMELENVTKMIEDIFWRRVEKVLATLRAKGHVDPAELTPEERVLFAPMEESFAELKKFVEGLLRGEFREPKPPEPTAPEEAPPQPGPTGPGRPRLMLVRILSDVPALVGADMRVHGPFKRGDVAFIPVENALGLIRKGLAVEVELREGA